MDADLLRVVFGRVGDSLWPLLAVLCFVFFVHSHFSFNKVRGSLAGPRWVPPILGNVVSMVINPTAFWDKQRLYNTNGLSVNNIAGQLIIFVTNTKLARLVMCRVQKYKLFAHPSAPTLLGKDNFIYMAAPEHKRFRAPLLKSFYGKEQLQQYLCEEEKCIRHHLELMTGKGYINVRQPLRVMAAHVSQTTMLGPYLSPKQQDVLADEYRWLTEAFIGFPIALPGNALWKGKRARKKILPILCDLAAVAKKNILNGGEPKCATDFWVVEQKKIDQMESDYEMGNAILDFLFASQDATTSSMVWMMCLLVANPDIRDKVRSEILEVCGSSTSTSADMIASHYSSLEYTQKVAMECLRHRPPVPMIPHVARSDQQITKNFFVPKGAMVIPSLTGAAIADSLDRNFDPEKMDDRDFNQTMVFGAGPHKCLGRKIAIQIIGLFTGIICCDYDFKRETSENCDAIRYLPTLYPTTNVFSLERRSKEPETKAE